MAMLLGVLLYGLSVAGATLAQNLQRRAQLARPPRRALNAFGVLLQILVAPLDLVAFGLAPQPLLAPLGTAGLLLNLSLAPWLNGDALLPGDASATLLVAVGGAVCLVSGDHGSVSTNLPFYRQAAFMGLVMATCGLLTIALRIRKDAGGNIDAAAHAGIAGILGSVTVVAAKDFLAALSAPDTLAACLTTAPLLLAVPLQLLAQNRGLGRHPALVMLPAIGASGLIANTTTGLVLYGETPSSVPWFAAGLTLVLCGLFWFCHTRPAAKEAPAVGASPSSPLLCEDGPRKRRGGGPP